MQEFKPQYKPLVVIMVDGWGIDVSWQRSGLTEQSIPNLSYLWHNYPHAALQSLDALRGPYPYVTNVAVAYETIGLGRVVKQPDALITETIHNQSFFTNPALNYIFDNCSTRKQALNLIGNISYDRPSSRWEHLFALIKLASMRGIQKINAHLMIDNSTATNVGTWLPSLAHALESVTEGGIASISGTGASSNDIIKAILGRGQATSNALAYLNDCTVRKINGESVTPISIVDEENRRKEWTKENYVVFFNTDGTPLLPIVEGLCDPMKSKKNLGDAKVFGVSLVNYPTKAQLRVAYSDKPVRNGLLETMAQYHYKVQIGALASMAPLYTSSLNGLNPNPWAGVETTIVKDSQNIDALVSSLSNLTTTVGNKIGNFDVTILSIPALEIASREKDILAMEKVARAADKEISRIVKYVMEVGGGVILTSPHAPMDATPKSFSHSNGPVPFSIIAQDRTKNLLATATGYYAKSGYLADMILSRRNIADIAPTILDLLRIPKPVAMTGQSLLTILR